MKVAQTIFEQLGGNKFVAMTGSKNFVASENFLRMNLTKNYWCKYTNVLNLKNFSFDN